jgi:hypothetical protein
MRQPDKKRFEDLSEHVCEFVVPMCEQSAGLLASAWFSLAIAFAKLLTDKGPNFWCIPDQRSVWCVPDALLASRGNTAVLHILWYLNCSAPLKPSLFFGDQPQ